MAEIHCKNCAGHKGWCSACKKPRPSGIRCHCQQGHRYRRVTCKDHTKTVLECDVCSRQSEDSHCLGPMSGYYTHINRGKTLICWSCAAFYHSAQEKAEKVAWDSLLEQCSRT